MSVTDLAVVTGGAALIAWELWFFLGSPSRSRGGQVTPPNRSGVQEVRVVVKGGYDPDTILVEAGRPVRLHFYRDETADCSERVVFDTLNIDEALPAFQTKTIEFIPPAPGDYPFRCAMSMLRGRVVAQEGRDVARANLGKGHHKHG